MARVTVKQEPNETGLARVGQGPRGLIINVDGKQVGRVYPILKGWQEYEGWYFTARGESVPLKNTAHEPPFTEKEDARDACVAYIKACLAAGVVAPK